MSITRLMSGNALIDAMEQVQDIRSIAASIRTKNNIRNRQPLPKLELVDPDGKYTWLAYAKDAQDIIKEEANVKEIVIYYDGMEIVI